jgi:hypothetical protein
MYTHNPPEQFSLVTRAESTCVERSFRASLRVRLVAAGLLRSVVADGSASGREPPWRTF